VVLFIVLAATCPGCSDVIWRPDMDGAKRDAANDGRVVLVYYASQMNRNSVQMDTTVFRDPAVIDAMSGTIPVRVDALFYKGWAEELGITEIPAFAVYGPDGSLIGLRQGLMNEAQFRAFVIGSKLSK
jgi:hypothetical protein